MEIKEMKEKLAELEHIQWSSWAKDIIEFYEENGLKELEKRFRKWKKQIKTRYNDLSEKEKDLDRIWANKIIELIKKEII